VHQVLPSRNMPFGIWVCLVVGRVRAPGRRNFLSPPATCTFMPSTRRLCLVEPGVSGGFVARRLLPATQTSSMSVRYLYSAPAETKVIGPCACLPCERRGPGLG